MIALSGFAQMFANEKFLIVAILLTVCYPLTLKCMRFIFREKHFSKKKLLIIVLCVMAVCGAIVAWVNRKEIGTFFRQGDFFHFDDSWGTYRGFIWKRSFWIFLDLPLIQKIFGCGLDTLRTMMNRFSVF